MPSEQSSGDLHLLFRFQGERAYPTANAGAADSTNAGAATDSGANTAAHTGAHTGASDSGSGTMQASDRLQHKWLVQ